jgi:hypothetical protein
MFAAQKHFDDAKSRGVSQSLKSRRMHDHAYVSQRIYIVKSVRPKTLRRKPKMTGACRLLFPVITRK